MIEIFSARNGQYYFRVVASNGNILCHSESYTTKQNAINGANACVNVAIHGSIVDRV